ncbi:4-alpha-glucanotransferase [Prochlorothrix hollandica]|uniref:4-alpha-glucanotransferase n=1 Tax=Prochlorothrix hollandica PCC 9006 = CALU 1027 TaxID=317619 RepID=A0A0M2PZN0_PROHO|nr:4-alpha-glucanotransferase [Prochlorothrix hollandica]KKI99836.1 4-alpha-glucanotransferase [Prochlorothrix hollandica PCC 9006 = CALU 1027]
MSFPRTSGILLHPTSLPGPFGIGDLGPEAYRFIDFLAASHQKLWQILPLGAPGFGNSPYLAYSAMAGNPMLISPHHLLDQGLLEAADLENLPDLPQDVAAFDQAIALKLPLFRKAFHTFQTQASPAQQEALATFCNAKASWLEDYSLFMAVKEAHQGSGWTAWEPGLAKRDPGVLAQWRERLAEDIAFQKFLQFEFFNQWSALRTYANDRGVQIIGDIPIYVAHDSVDVWAHPENFCLNPKTGYAALMAGVPPDYFSETGQLWGNPVYNWDYLQQSQFAWWIQRFESLLDYVDIIRIDHFRGLQAYWVVPEGETTAMKGWWVEAPGYAFFNRIRDHFGKLPIIAEDLGIITPEVDALRDTFDFPGMKILQFSFDSGVENPYLPFNFAHANCVVYTGTHDNNTTVGWFSDRSLPEQWQVAQYLGHRSFHGIHWDLITLALGSVANQAITPLQDVLGLGTEARMNFPSQAAGNWNWRYRAEHLTPKLSDRLGQLTIAFGRA